MQKLQEAGGFDVVNLLEINSDLVAKVAEGLKVPDGHCSYSEYPPDRFIAPGNSAAMFTGEGCTPPTALIMDRGRPAMTTRAGGIAVVGFQLEHRPWRPDSRRAQIGDVLDHIGDGEAIVMGDFNSFYADPLRRRGAHTPREMLRQAGFRSAFAPPENKRRPERTFPTDELCELGFHGVIGAAGRLYLKAINGIALDDIMVRGDFEVKDSGRIIGPSDHVGLWITVKQTAPLG